MTFFTQRSTLPLFLVAIALLLGFFGEFVIHDANQQEMDLQLAMHAMIEHAPLAADPEAAIQNTMHWIETQGEELHHKYQVSLEGGYALLLIAVVVFSTGVLLFLLMPVEKEANDEVVVYHG
jgi:hypothetical protein